MSSLSVRGTWLALLAFGLWGVFPLYFRALHALPPGEILAHRILWSFSSVTLFLAYKSRGGAALSLWKQKARRPVLVAGALLVSSNWLIYIWGVNSGHVLETSLGYFLTPLFNIAMGVLFLGERLRPLQKIAVGLAATGIAWMLLHKGSEPPWIALGIMVTFGLYGLVKKKSQVESVSALAFENTLLVVPSLIYLVVAGRSPAGMVASLGGTGTFLLLVSGVVTLIPLWAFSEAARLLPMSILGFFQYLAPLLQLMCGLYLGESFAPGQREAFVAIWIALSLVSWNAVYERRRR